MGINISSSSFLLFPLKMYILQKIHRNVRKDIVKKINRNEEFEFDPMQLGSITQFQCIFQKGSKKMERSSSQEIDPHLSPPPKYARHSPIRFLLLLMVIFVAFVNQYSFNNPQALELSMQTILEIKESQFQLFYSLYSLPNIFTLVLIGYFCDVFGVRISLVILSGLIAFFQMIIAIGGYLKSYYLILAGRILFGVVSEAIFIPQASIISFWFQGKEQALALGIGITFPQLGNALNSYLTPLIFEKTQNLGSPLLFSFILCLFGFMCSLIAAYLDYRAEKIDEMNQILKVQQQSEQDEEIKLSDIKKLKRSFWIVAAVCTAANSLWIPFLDNVNKLYQVRFCFTQVTAGKVISIVYLVTVLTSIPLGLLVDAYGNRRVLTTIALVVFLTAQLIFLLYPQCQEGDSGEIGAISGLFFEGLGYSFYANVLVASIPLVTKSKFLGTAFGIITMLQSFFEFLIPLMTGFIVSSSSSQGLGYRFSSLIFVILGLIGFGISFLLYFSISEHCKHKLDRSSHELELMIKIRERTPQLVSQTSASTTSEGALLRKSSSTFQNSNRIKETHSGQSKQATKPFLSSFQFEL